MVQKIQKTRPFDARLLAFCSTDYQKEVYRAYGRCGSNANETARYLTEKKGRSVDASSVSQAVRKIQDKGREVIGTLEVDEVDEIVTQDLNILIFDIETAPAQAYVWDFYNQNIGHEQIIAYGHVMSFAAKWMGTEEVMYEDCRDGNDKKLTMKLMKLFDKADVVVGHNGKAFDVKTMKGRALVHGLKPPSPYKIVDTFLIAKQEFKLPRNSLEFIADHLGCTPKLKHVDFPGFALWKECLDGNDLAWESMKKYNIQDIDTLEEVYLKLRAWSTTHPNLGIYLDEARPLCPKCYSGELRTINPIRTNTQIYSGYRCNNCGSVCRGKNTIADKIKRKSLLVNAA